MYSEHQPSILSQLLHASSYTLLIIANTLLRKYQSKSLPLLNICHFNYFRITIALPSFRAVASVQPSDISAKDDFFFGMLSTSFANYTKED